MPLHALRLRAAVWVAGVVLLAFSGWASADPPARVGRLGYLSGVVSFSPAGETDWDPARLNRPLGSGDRLWTDPGARAEIQVGGAFMRMNAQTRVAVRQLDDQITQLQLTQGTLNVRVRHLGPEQEIEVDTPQLALTLRQPGVYRIVVDPDGQVTEVIVRQGQGEVQDGGAVLVLVAPQAYRFSGTGGRDYAALPLPAEDEFDRWASRRDRADEDSVSARYVSPDVLGYQDLDANGRWRLDAAYGNIWIPYRVAAGWAPYRDGHWVWVAPWGWTWVDDAPWGFAVSHYGRWIHLQGVWCWVPGPVRVLAYYAPALVVFVDGSHVPLAPASGNVGAVAWFPLAPREVYRPPYPVSRAYFERINRSNTDVSTRLIQSSDASRVAPVRYANRGVPGAVVAVPASAFVQSQPVARAALPLPRNPWAGAAVTHLAPVAPPLPRPAVTGPLPAVPTPVAPAPVVPVPVVRPPESRVRAEQRDQAEPRRPAGIPRAAMPSGPPPRAAEPRVLAPPVVAPAPQRPTLAPAKSAPVPVARKVESRAPLAAPQAPAVQLPPKAAPNAHRPRPAANPPGEPEPERRRAEERHKPSRSGAPGEAEPATQRHP